MKKVSLEDRTKSRRVNNWVNPSFCDPSSKSEDKPVRTSRPESKRSRKRKEDGNNFFQITESTDRDPDEPWVDKYSPCSQAELAVHKKKIEEVENWMRAHINGSKGGILILTGPPGSGKTATVQVLSMELGVRVQEWTNPTSVEPYWAGQSADWSSRGLSFSTQSAQFHEFLLRVNKYKCLKMKGEGEPVEKRLILVEDFPNQFYRQPCSFHDMLRTYMKNSRCPLVFIVSGSRGGEGSLRSLFPREIQEELQISSISFNPVAPTAMIKVLKTILYTEAEKSPQRLYVPDKAEMEMLCSGTSGDIRCAINSLQFSCLPEKGLCSTKKPPARLDKAVTASKPRAKRAKSTKELEEPQAIGGKDVSFFLFRALGKILHCKRGTSEDANETKAPSGPDLPVHLLHHRRESLLVEPELVVERSQTSGEFFSLCLHQNYPDFFSHIEDVDRASEYLSDGDLLTGNWTIRDILGDYGSSVAARGLIHSNSCQVPVGFRPLHKPSWCLVNKKHQENCLAAQSLFRSLRLTPVSLQTELLPFLAKLSNSTRSPAQVAVIQDVGQMSLKTFSGRLKLENLTDREMGQELEEEDVEPCRSEKDLQVSESPLATDQPLLEEDDQIIEEYESD